MVKPRRLTITDEQQTIIDDMLRSGATHRDIARKAQVGLGTISKYRNSTVRPRDKKVADFSWREWSDHASNAQKLYKRASQTQKTATIELGDGKSPVLLVPFSDQHIGGRGVNYGEFVRMTDMILSIPNAYFALLGDYTEYAIKLRSVAEVCAQLFDPAKQDQFIEQWFDEIWHKVAWATWDNHTIERQEKFTGSSATKRHFAKKVVFFDGIGHVDVVVGEQTYRWAVSHKFRGYSYQNPCHAGMRYMRFEGADREIAAMGDVHTPAFISYNDGERERLSLVSGTLNVDSTYANRYFSIFTQSHYPCVELHPTLHEFTPYKSIDRWLRTQGKTVEDYCKPIK